MFSEWLWLILLLVGVTDSPKSVLRMVEIFSLKAIRNNNRSSKCMKGQLPDGDKCSYTHVNNICPVAEHVSLLKIACMD